MSTATCIECGREIPGGRLGRLCSHCLLVLAVESLPTKPGPDVPEGDAGQHSPPESSLGNQLHLELPPGLTEKPGDRIDRYRLLQDIGEGGFGVVYLAEQDEPVKRRVALKIIKLGMDTRQVVARFEAERQALAVMDHPNIAKVLDAGATETGRPYFVMELVPGAKITEYCDRNKLPTPERLRLFIQVCRAIQHAHQKGIIHRDLKPSNVLVTSSDGTALPKIIDFGIAKATQHELTEQTVFTELGQFLGTPAYMSPEQARMTNQDIDTRSDIYSLGVLLYELLTGQTPFDTKELLASGLDGMRRTICEKEPMRPSTRLRQMPVASGAQRPHRSVRLPTDLDWIVMKCLEKDRTRRYETANGLAMDIERHLNQEPVFARPPSNVYRLQKLVRRNKVAFAAATAVVVALVIALGLSLWSLWQEKAALRRTIAAEAQARQAQANEANLRQQAETNQKKAETEAEKSQQVTKLLKGVFNGVGPSKAKGRNTEMLREILDETVARIDKELNQAPEVEDEIRDTLGNVYLALGEYPSAEKMYRQVLALRRKMLGEEHPRVARALNNVGLALWREGKLAEAEDCYRQALGVERKVLGNEHASVAKALNNLGIVLADEGKLDEAEAAYREGLTIERRLAIANDPNLARFLSNLAHLLRRQGKLAESEKVERDALALKQQTLGDEDPDVARSLNGLGLLLADEGKFAEAEQFLRDALATRRKVLHESHPDVAVSIGDLAAVLRLEGRLKESEAMQRQALVLKKKALGDQHDEVARSLFQLALLAADQKKWTEAEALHREALTIRVNLFGRQNPIVANSLASLAEVLRAQAQLTNAEALQREALETRRKLLGRNHADVADSLEGLALVLRDEGRLPEAVTAARECLVVNDNQPEEWTAFSARSLVGSLLVMQKEYADAEPLLLSGYEGMTQRLDRIPVPERIRLQTTAQSLVELYEAKGLTNQVLSWKAIAVPAHNRTTSNTEAAAKPAGPH